MPLPKFIVTSEAREDLDNIWGYIAANNAEAADKVEDEITQAFYRLGEHPYMGHKREDLTAREVRFWSVYSYLIIYDPHRQPISIVRVLSGWRDVAGMLG